MRKNDYIIQNIQERLAMCLNTFKGINFVDEDKYQISEVVVSFEALISMLDLLKHEEA